MLAVLRDTDTVVLHSRAAANVAQDQYLDMFLLSFAGWLIPGRYRMLTLPGQPNAELVEVAEEDDCEGAREH